MTKEAIHVIYTSKKLTGNNYHLFIMYLSNEIMSMQRTFFVSKSPDVQPMTFLLQNGQCIISNNFDNVYEHFIHTWCKHGCITLVT